MRVDDPPDPPDPPASPIPRPGGAVGKAGSGVSTDALRGRGSPGTGDGWTGGMDGGGYIRGGRGGRW